jgi:sulfite reductase alpha subunit-like flavoprotein
MMSYAQVYVQDILIQNASITYEMVVKRGGHFYVCGDVSMANDVTKTLEQILSQQGGMKAEQAKNFVLKLKVKSLKDFLEIKFIQR